MNKHKCSEKLKKWLSKERLAEKNPMWKGDNVGYDALHGWIKKRLKKPNFCEICHKKPPMDLANISQKYKRDLEDWEWLCRRCHMIKDGRLKKFIKISKNKRLPDKNCYTCDKKFHSTNREKKYCSRKCYFFNKSHKLII